MGDKGLFWQRSALACISLPYTLETVLSLVRDHELVLHRLLESLCSLWLRSAVFGRLSPPLLARRNTHTRSTSPIPSHPYDPQPTGLAGLQVTCGLPYGSPTCSSQCSLWDGVSSEDKMEVPIDTKFVTSVCSAHAHTYLGVGSGVAGKVG